MSGQLWSQPTEGGYLYSDNLSEWLRFELQPACKMRQMCDAKDDAIGLHKGDTYRWNVYGNVAQNGRPLVENKRVPETNFDISQKTLTITEYANSVPYTGKVEALGEHDVKDVIRQTLKDDVKKVLDRSAAYQIDQTPLRVAPTGGTSTTSVTLETGGASTITNDVALGNGHVKAIVDLMKERNIPPFLADDYVAVSHQSTFRPFKNDLEAIHQYTEAGIGLIFAGEIGRYEGCRFIEQTNIVKGHAEDAAFTETDGDTNDIYAASDDAWNNAKSSWAYFMGADVAIESPAIPEEIRAKLPGDYGRDKGIAYYYLGGFGLCHDVAADARVIKWDSAA